MNNAKCLEMTGGTDISSLWQKSTKEHDWIQDAGCSRRWMLQLETNGGQQ